MLFTVVPMVSYSFVISMLFTVVPLVKYSLCVINAVYHGPTGKLFTLFYLELVINAVYRGSQYFIIDVGHIQYPVLS